MTEYIARFCPHCGGHVNEEELLNDHDLTPEEIAATVDPPNWGALYTCGWCHEQTRDWGHVIRCRTEHTVRKRVNHEKRARDLHLMLKEMDDEALAAMPVHLRG